MDMLLDDPDLIQATWSGPTDLGRYEPTPADLAYQLSYDAARSGRVAQSPRCLDRAVRRAHHAGRLDGTAAREADAARDLGRTMALVGGANEPFPDYTLAEAAAFAAGYAEGEAELDDDRAFEAWVASAEAERMQRAFEHPISDLDVYRHGETS